ncbi:MAG: peptide chain release factor 1 [Pseudomonadota bacterium]
MLDSKFDKLLSRESQLNEQLLDAQQMDAKTYQDISREYAQILPICDEIRRYYESHKEQTNLVEMCKDDDPEIRAMAEIELEEAKAKSIDISNKLKIAMLPKDIDDERNALIEIRPGTGGDEATLFASSLMQMYLRYADLKGWKSETLALSDSEIGGINFASISLTGKEVYARMKFESGVHRVQRVPTTESSGRIHTSAATVAVLPEVDEIDVAIEDKDLRIDTYRSQGAGGQHVNTTDSAVRITHLPSGVVAQCQDEKSQHKNKARAMKMLMARLYDHAKQQSEQARAAQRKGQVGSGDRSERIRTYNFPQGRVSDHRINLTLYKLNQILQGEGLDEIIDALLIEDQAARLTAQDDDDE